MIRPIDARFVTTAVTPDGYPRQEGPEVAFVGRSNVGKSSMINVLAGRKKLVRVSNTPGRTRTLNFFDVDVERTNGPDAKLSKELFAVRFADLPGYGFAKASKTDRAQWQKMIGTYLMGRKALKVVVSIIDAEVGPTDEDYNTLDFLNENVDRILVIGTKIDRLAKAKRKPRLNELANLLEIPRDALIGFSAVDLTGLQDVWENMMDALFPAASPGKKAKTERKGSKL